MVFGEAVVLDGKYSFYSRHKKKIQYIIDTMCDLSEKHQGMLIQVFTTAGNGMNLDRLILSSITGYRKIACR